MPSSIHHTRIPSQHINVIHSPHTRNTLSVTIVHSAHTYHLTAYQHRLFTSHMNHHTACQHHQFTTARVASQSVSIVHTPHTIITSYRVSYSIQHTHITSYCVCIVHSSHTHVLATHTYHLIVAASCTHRTHLSHHNYYQHRPLTAHTHHLILCQHRPFTTRLLHLSALSIYHTPITS